MVPDRNDRKFCHPDAGDPLCDHGAGAASSRGKPSHDLGNRDGRTARLPRAGSVVQILDDLDNLWDVPEGNNLSL